MFFIVCFTICEYWATRKEELDVGRQVLFLVFLFFVGYGQAWKVWSGQERKGYTSSLA